MPTSDALMGLGMPSQTAQRLGGNYSLLNCSGTTQSGAAIALTKNVELNVSSGQTAAILPSNAEVNDPYFFINPDATTALVYVPSGHTLATVTSGGANGHVSIAQNTSATFWQYKPKNWACILSATA